VRGGEGGGEIWNDDGDSKTVGSEEGCIV
jgi:hypothetical protein